MERAFVSFTVSKATNATVLLVAMSVGKGNRYRFYRCSDDHWGRHRYSSYMS
jgi:hypothetical protein